MIVITITDTPIREMKGIGKTSGKPYHMRIQTGYAHTVNSDGTTNDFPDKFEIALEDGQSAYTKGKYQLSPSSLFVSRDGRLELRPRLAPLQAQPKPAA